MTTLPNPEHEARPKAAEDEIEFVARHVYDVMEGLVGATDQARARSWGRETESYRDRIRDLAAAAISAQAAWGGGAR